MPDDALFQDYIGASNSHFDAEQALSVAQLQLQQLEMRDGRSLPRGHRMQQELAAATRQEQQASKELHLAKRALTVPDSA